MSKGFSFDHGKCVNCGACNAACILYNDRDRPPRKIYVYNEQLLHDLPLVNISLACNHCDKAACLEGCPSGALSKIGPEGAVILDEKRCLGCRYCLWNCPYDAPKYSSKKRIIEKCHLCHDSDEMPACADACPTGALTFREISSGGDSKNPEWFPTGKLNPRLEFTGRPDPETLKIIPSERFMEKDGLNSEETTTPEWSLIGFSFMASIAVSVSTVSLINGTFPGILFFSLLTSAGLISLFHLGRPVNAWKAVINPVSSPLSREIIGYLLFGSLSVLAVLWKSPGLFLASIISGFIFLIVIDSVYWKPDKKVMLHSGQAFLSSLLLISYLAGDLLPFTFITIIKVFLSVRNLSGKDHEAFRFIRIAFLVLVWAGLISGYGIRSTSLTIIILSAELIDRYLFYIDFKPENIVHLIEKNIKSHYYEKKRD